MATLIRMLREKEILTITGWSRATLRRRINDGKFPPPMMSSQRMREWPEPVVEKHQRERMEKAGLLVSGAAADLIETAV